MKLYFLTALFSIAALQVAAQHSEVNVNLYSLTAYQQKQARDSNYNNSVDNAPSSLKSIGVLYANKKNVSFSLQYGFARYNNFSQTDYYDNNTNALRSVVSSGNKLSTHFLKLSVGKEYYYNKLSLHSQLALPFFYNYNSSYDYRNTSYTTQGTQTYTVTRINPEEFRMGLWLSQGFYYNIYKRFLLGTEFNYGIERNVLNGSYNIHEKASLESNVLSDNYYAVSAQTARWNSVFSASIGVRYILWYKQSTTEGFHEMQ